MRTNLIKARLRNGLTQVQLGKTVGLSAQSICDIEKGRTKGTVDTWDALALALGVDQKVLREITVSQNVSAEKPTN